MMAVDISGSMLALDLQYLGQTATRLEVVKAVMEDFIERRPSDRIGIVAFASEPYLVSPVTLHHDWLKENLARIEVGIVPSTGTSIGPPIGMAANRLGNLEESKSRIIILLTDGKDQPPPPIEPLVYARAANALGVKVYTIAIGTGGIVRTFVPDGRGGLRRDFSGRPLVTTAQHELDEDILRRIAEETDARFYRARDSEELQRIYQEIDQLEKTEVRLVYHTDYEDAFFPPLASGLILLVLEQLLAATRLRTLP
jgi:Ca-activated chloride channel family protein